MQKAISKYGLAAHLALLAVAPLFLFPFCGAVWTARVLLWLSFLAFVWTLVEPSRRQGEMLHDARFRVFLSVFRDPLFWFSLFLSLVAFVRWLNGGVAMAYDAENSVWSLRAPAIPFLPGSVSESGYLPFAATLAVAVMMQGCRHALGKSARGAFLFMASFLAGTASIAAIVSAACGHAGALAASACANSDATFAGNAFGLHLAGMDAPVANLALSCESIQPSRIDTVWLEAFGLAADGLDDLADADGDGLTNYEEWLCGTSPLDAGDALVIDSATAGPGGFTLGWKAIPGLTYAIESANAPNASFNTIATLAATNSAMSYTDTRALSNAFYRVTLPAPPRQSSLFVE